MSKIKRFEVVRPEYSFEYIHPILGRLALPIAMIKVMVKCTKIYRFQPTINWGGEVKNVCKPLYKIVIPKRVRKKQK
jgi:hypothetical protein